MDSGSEEENTAKVCLDYRRRPQKHRKRTPVQGLCLFCNANFPRSHPYPHHPSLDKVASNIPKYRRSFAYLATELGVPIQPSKKIGEENTKNQTEFSFISEQVPLCSDCLKLLDQVNLLFLKLQGVKFQLAEIVGKIRASVIKSRANSNPIYTEVELENESHFNFFRRQVEEEDRPPHPCDLKISLPQIRIRRLDSAEVERQTKRKQIQVEEPEEDEVNELNFSNLIEGEPNSFDDFFMDSLDDCGDNGVEMDDVKPDISELRRDINMSKGNGIQSNVNEVAIEVPQFQVELPFECDTLRNDEHVQPTETFPTLCLVTSGVEPPVLQIQTVPSVVPEQEIVTAINPPTATMSSSSPTNNITNTITPPIKKKRQRTIYPKDEDEDTCKLCSIPFKTQKELADHYRSTHPGEFPRHCPQGCGYGALLPNAIRKHIFLKHGPPEAKEAKKNMICDICGKRFFSGKNLNYHIRMHKNLKPFGCSQCDKKFRCQQAADVHVFRIHENVRNFACPHCPWKFKDHVSLKGHIATHTGEKNYSCHICPNRKFIQHHALKSHWRVHKKNGDWTEPPDFKKPRGGWVRKSRQNPQPQPAQQEEQDKAEQEDLSLGV